MFHWDGFITPGLTDRLVTSLDIVPTVLGLVNYTEEIVQGHGVDVGPILFDGMHEVEINLIHLYIHVQLILF